VNSKPVTSLEPAPPAAVAGEASAESRRALLGEAPRHLGASWALGWCEALRAEGREIDGGWPGTLQEARSRVRVHFDGELSRRGMPELTREELAVATAATYERARQDWLKSARATKRPRAKTGDDDEA
jgi:hypothetical protein